MAWYDKVKKELKEKTVRTSAPSWAMDIKKKLAPSIEKRIPKPLDFKLEDIKTLPSGKGQYIFSTEGLKKTSTKKYGTLPVKKGYERDHIIPYALGGTSDDPNMQYLKGASWWDRTFVKNPFKRESRQQGKMVVELKTIKDYEDGKIGINEARQRVLNWENTPEPLTKLYAKELIMNPPAQTAMSGLRILSSISPALKTFTNLFKAQQQTSELENIGQFVEGAARHITGSSYLLASIPAGAAALAPGGATPRQAIQESFNMAKDVLFDPNTPTDEGVSQAAEMWLENRSIGKYGGAKPGVADVAALSVLGFFHLFGDPVFSIGIGLKGARVLKETLKYKKVREVIKARPKGLKIQRNVYLNVTDDLKVKVVPKQKEVIFEGYKKRFPSQKALPEGKLAQETKDLIMSTQKATDVDIIAKFKGDDLILSPKIERIVQPTVKAIPKTLEPLKYKSAEEFVENTIKTTKDNTPLVNRQYFKSYPLAQNKIKIIDISELETLSVPANREVVIREIREKGLIPPIVDTATGEVIDGNHRVAVLQELGFKKIPVIEDADAWVQEADTYGQIPWNIPEGEIGKVKPNQLAKELVDYSKTKSQLTDIWKQAQKEKKLPKVKRPPIIPKKKPVKTIRELTGEVKPTKVAADIEQKFVEKKLTESFGDIAGYEPITIKDQASRAANLMKSDFNKAVDMVAGRIPMQKGLRGEMLIKTMEEHALKQGDVDLALEIARSPLVAETSVHAQALRLLAERETTSPVKVISDISKKRKVAYEKKTGKKIKKKLTDEQKKIKREIKAVKKSERDLNNFIQSIKC